MPELALVDLLKPIPGENPAGEDLRYSATYEEIKEARREEDDLSQGAWKRERKIADYRLVIKLAAQALGEKSKDLQLGAWLAEALVHEQGYGGLRSGIELNLRLLESFWEHLYPKLEEDDAELRAAPLAWLGSKLETAVRHVPLAAAGQDWFAYKDARAVGYEEPQATPEQKKAREKALSEGRLSAEAFDKEFAATPRAYYAQAETDLSSALSLLRTLDELCTARFGDAAPAFGKLRDAIAEVQHVVHGLLQKKGEAAEDMPQAVELHASDSVAAEPVAIADVSVRAATESFALALAALRAGRQQQALQVLSRDLATQSSGRGRFLRKLELARVCIAAGRDSIAQPLLDDLASTIDIHKLDEWEENETVAAALVTILQSSRRIQSDAKEKQKFFERICRLDPAQALGCQV